MNLVFHSTRSFAAKLITAIVFIFLFIPGALVAQSGSKGQLRMTPVELKNAESIIKDAPGSSNLSAVQVVVIYGDPSRAGLYTILLKVAAHTRIPAHLHPDERVGTVVKGTWFFGYGDTFDESHLKELPVGSIYSEVAGQNHFAMTKDEAIVVEITGYGPSGVTYINAKDDPKK